MTKFKSVRRRGTSNSGSNSSATSTGAGSRIRRALTSTSSTSTAVEDGKKDSFTKESTTTTTSTTSPKDPATALRQRLNHMLYGQAPPAAQDLETLVLPQYDYPNQWMTAQELHQEMMLPSTKFYDLRQQQDDTTPLLAEEPKVDDNGKSIAKQSSQSTTTSSPTTIGHLRVEVLQCIGLPELDLMTDSDTVVYLVCGNCAFNTAVISDMTNPQWLPRSKRACIFPIHHAYARLYVGVFDDDGEKAKDDFAGRAVVDVARLRHDCVYDVILPLRLSTHLYTRRPRGAVRLRFSLHRDAPERAWLTSYLPNPKTFKIVTPKKSKPNFDTTIACADATAFRNVALTVHGHDLPNKFSFVKIKGLIKEIIFILRFHMQGLRQEIKDTYHWVNPFTSAFIFVAWMHCIYEASVGKVPGYFGIYLLIRLTRNYAIYAIQGSMEQGFLPPTGEELMGSLVFGDNCIEPMELQHDNDPAAAAAKEEGRITAIEQHNTHKPWWVWLFKLLGFIPWDHTKAPNLHLEFPFARGDVYEKFTLQEAIADRDDVRPENDKSTAHNHEDTNNAERLMLTQAGQQDGILSEVDDTKGSGSLKTSSSSPSSPSRDSPTTPTDSASPNIAKFKQMLFTETQDEFMDADAYDEDGINDIFGDNDNFHPKNPTASVPTVPGDPTMPTEVRKEQNLDWRPKNKPPETLPQKLDRISNKIHSITLHTFHDHSYTIKNPNARYFSEKFLIDTQRRTDRMKRRNQRNVSKKLDELLEVGAFSGNGPVVDRVGLLIEPMISGIYSFVCLFRSMFNLATWQDPYHTFWLYLFIFLLTMVFFIIPWRPVLFIGGLVFVGPQNYLIRKLRDWKILPPIKPRTPKVETEKVEKPPHVFYSHQRGDGLKPPKTPPSADPDEIHHVVVPYGRMMHQRFYDWPPEQEYATVTPIKEDKRHSEDVPSLRGASIRTNRPSPSSRERRRDRPRGQRVRKLFGRLRRKKNRGSDDNMSPYNSDDGLESVDETGSLPGQFHDQYSVVSTDSRPRAPTETTALLQAKS